MKLVHFLLLTFFLFGCKVKTSESATYPYEGYYLSGFGKNARIMQLTSDVLLLMPYSFHIDTAIFDPHEKVWKAVDKRIKDLDTIRIAYKEDIAGKKRCVIDAEGQVFILRQPHPGFSVE